MRLFYAILAGALLTASGCAGGAPRALPPDHPASPAAASSAAAIDADPFALTVQPAPLDGSDPTIAGIQRAHAGMSAGAGETHFECPMHPKVQQAGPGICPDCEMDLVKMPGKIGEHHHP